MSYLDTPRICFTGTFTARGPTRNNLLLALDQPAILGQNPPWDYDPKANADFLLDGCTVATALDADGHPVTADAVLGAQVLGAGKMVDLDPEHRRVTELVGMFLTLALPGDGSGAAPASVSGKFESTPLRDFWMTPAPVIVTAWQSAIRGPSWSAGVDRSGVLKQLRDLKPEGLSVRLTLLAAPGGSGLATRIMGAIGPWSGAEPRQFVAARRLIAARPAGQYPFPAATFQVDARRSKLVVDLGDMTVDPGTAPAAVALAGVAATILDDPPAVPTLIAPPRDLTAAQWLNAAGIVEWDLTADQARLLHDRRLRVTLALGGDPLILEEHPTGNYVDIDRRSVRLNPGESAGIDVYARNLGRPLTGQVINFSLRQQKAIAAVETIITSPTEFGYPPNPDLPINSEPSGVLLDRPGPLQVVTDARGYARLTIRARPGEIDLPDARRTIDSQLYFLGEPEGWQSWGAIGPNNGLLNSTPVGDGCALTVLVFNTHAPIPNPTWDDIAPWLRRYAILFPAMLLEARLNIGDKDQVDRDAYEIYRRLKCLDWDDVQFMPISRDLSAFRRDTILAYLRSVMPGKPPC